MLRMSRKGMAKNILLVITFYCVFKQTEILFRAVVPKVGGEKL